MSEDTKGGAGRAAGEAASYAFQPRIGGAGARFSLAPGRLNWSVGPREGSLAFTDIREVRLFFSPAKLASASYEVLVVGAGGEKLRIGSVSRVSLTGIKDQGADYAAFLRAFLAALGASPARPAYVAGFAGWRWWLMVPLAIGTVMAMIAILGLALWRGQWVFTVLLGLLGAVVVWPTVEMLWRNRPGTFTPQDPPAYLLPR